MHMTPQSKPLCCEMGFWFCVVYVVRYNLFIKFCIHRAQRCVVRMESYCVIIFVVWFTVTKQQCSLSQTGRNHTLVISEGSHGGIFSSGSFGSLW